MKVIETIKKFCAWVAIDGLLHALVCYGIMLAVYPMFESHEAGILWSFATACAASMGKEIYDVFRTQCTPEHCWHDLLCDAIGMGCGSLTWFVWWICKL